MLINHLMPLYRPFLTLPGLVGLWSMQAGNPDLSGNLHTLSTSGSLSYGMATGGGCAVVKATANPYLYADNAPWNSPAADLFLAGYVQHTNAGTLEGIAGKFYAAGNQRSYVLYRTATTGLLIGTISPNGESGTVRSVTSSVAIETTWTFVALRFTPSVNLAVWVNDAVSEVTTAVPAACFGSTGALQIGNYNGTSGGVIGNIGIFAMCHASPTNAAVLALFNATRSFYGV